MSPLSPRAEIFLKALVERYIADGQPVGSRTLAKETGLDLSPATVRNIMADLEDLGLISSPHTSAGRVPTQLGYRMFVDSLLTARMPRHSHLKHIEGGFNAAAAGKDPQQVVESASQLLSQLTKLAGVVRLPRREFGSFRHLEFLSLSPGRVLVILVTQDGRVHNRVIQTDKTYSPSELIQAANFFNETYSGKTLLEVKAALVAAMQQDSDAMQSIMRGAMTMAHKVFTDDTQAPGADLVVSGEANLWDVPELGDLNKLRKLFDAFSTKRDLLHLLDQSVRANGVQIFIGAESGYLAFEELSLVTAPYQADSHTVGTLAVIGPTRMPYERVISIVDVTARLLSTALSQERGQERAEPAA